MKGIEISKLYWENFGKEMIKNQFPDIFDRIAVGLVGSGSECYGYDDELSRDHDFEPGFCIFLPGEDIIDRHTEFMLERAYSSLPREFMGLYKNKENPAGGKRNGVFRVADFYLNLTGIPHEPQTWRDWLSVPDHAVFEASDGEVFHDNLGDFSKIRSAWSNPPQDIRLKKLCGFLILMSQTGEYNYNRCLMRGETDAAALTAAEFVNACISAALWVNGRPAPYYKWKFRALKDICGISDDSPLCIALKNILSAVNVKDNISVACNEIISMIRKNPDLLPCRANDLQSIAISFNEQINDPDLRNLSLLAAV